jgi:mannonate dehydratase
LNGRELAVASYLTDHVIPLLIGRDARRIEDIWQYLYKGAYWRRGPVTMAAIGAVDTALWDIRGKSLNAPVYQLIGGASREAVMVYGHANGSTIDETIVAVKRYADLAYQAVRAQCAVPGLAATYGVGRGELYYEPAEPGLPPETPWSSERYLAFVPSLFDALRREFDGAASAPRRPPPAPPIEAGPPRQSLEPHHLFWLEDRHDRSAGQLPHHSPAHDADRRGKVFNTI